MGHTKALFQARIAFARKQFPAALKLYQQVLSLSPYSTPDPRIGIGLCLWAMDQRAKAKACWERSLEVVRPLSSFHEIFLSDYMGLSSNRTKIGLHNFSLGLRQSTRAKTHSSQKKIGRRITSSGPSILRGRSMVTREMRRRRMHCVTISCGRVI